MTTTPPTCQREWVAVDLFTGEVITDNQATRAVTMHQQIFDALAAVCKMLPERDESGAYLWRMMTRTERGMLNKASKELAQSGRTPDDVYYFGEWFESNDWRGQRGQSPLPTDVIKMITRSCQDRTEHSAAISNDLERYKRDKETPGTAAYRLAHRSDNE